MGASRARDNSGATPGSDRGRVRACRGRARTRAAGSGPHSGQGRLAHLPVGIAALSWHASSTRTRPSPLIQKKSPSDRSGRWGLAFLGGGSGRSTIRPARFRREELIMARRGTLLIALVLGTLPAAPGIGTAQQVTKAAPISTVSPPIILDTVGLFQARAARVGGE